MSNDTKQGTEEAKMEYLKNRQSAVDPMKCWSPAKLTPEQQAEQDEYIKANQLPF